MNNGIIGIGKTCSVQDSHRQQDRQPVMKTLCLTKSLCCPSLQAILISASQLLDKYITISLTTSGCVIAAPDGETAAEARAEHDLFLLSS
jgi:hypothetical protein